MEKVSLARSFYSVDFSFFVEQNIVWCIFSHAVCHSLSLFVTLCACGWVLLCLYKLLFNKPKIKLCSKLFLENLAHFSTVTLYTVSFFVVFFSIFLRCFIISLNYLRPLNKTSYTENYFIYMQDLGFYDTVNINIWKLGNYTLSQQQRQQQQRIVKQKMLVK